MNNLPNNHNQKIAGVFKTKNAANDFIKKLKNMIPPLANYQYKLYEVLKDKILISATINNNDYIVVIEGKREVIEQISDKITFNGGCFLSSEQMSTFLDINNWLLELS